MHSHERVTMQRHSIKSVVVTAATHNSHEQPDRPWKCARASEDAAYAPLYEGARRKRSAPAPKSLLTHFLLLKAHSPASSPSSV